MIQSNIRMNDDFKYVELTMNKEDIDIFEYQKNNFPREIKFLAEDKKVILALKFNEFGFMVKAVDKLEKILIENKILEKISTDKLIEELEKRKMR